MVFRVYEHALDGEVVSLPSDTHHAAVVGHEQHAGLEFEGLAVVGEVAAALHTESIEGHFLCLCVVGQVDVVSFDNPFVIIFNHRWVSLGY